MKKDMKKLVSIVLTGIMVFLWQDVREIRKQKIRILAETVQRLQLKL